MSNSPKAKNRPPSSSDDLARLCLEHAEDEEQALRAALESLGLFHEALRGGTPEEQEAALRRQEAVSRLAGDLRAKRAALRSQLSAELHTHPEAVTLSLVSQHLDRPAAEQLRQARDRLRCLAAETDRRAAEAAALTFAGLEYLQNIFHALTGEPPSPGRYARAGGMQPVARGALLQARG